MTKGDQLRQKELELSEQLEDKGRQRGRAEQLYSDFEWYASDDQFLEQQLWEAAYQSKYAWQLEDTANQMRASKLQLFNDLTDHIDGLKKDERYIEDQLDVLYTEKQKAFWEEEEKRYGY